MAKEWLFLDILDQLYLLNTVISWLSQILFIWFDIVIDESRICVYNILQMCTCTTAGSCVSVMQKNKLRSSTYSSKNPSEL